MKKKQLSLLLILILILTIGLVACGKKDTGAVSETETSETSDNSEQLSESMSHYQNIAKENILLLAQKNHLTIALQYYRNNEMNQSADNFTQKTFEEELMGTTNDGTNEILIAYPDFNPDSVEIVIPDISEEEADAKSLELETQNEELKKTIEEMQQVLDNYKLISGL